MKSRIPLSEYSPEIAAQWHPTKNGNLTPDQVTFGSDKKAWWYCEKGHEWIAKVNHRTINKNNCPCCSGRKPIPGQTDLATLNPNLASEWHPTKNDELTPNMVASNSGKKVWWLCQDCGHEWEAKVASRNRGSNCPNCRKIQTIARRKEAQQPKERAKQSKVKKNPLTRTCPELAAQWHPTKNGTLTPEQVTKSSEKIVWWLCPDCGHEWEVRVKTRAKGSRCPSCAQKHRGRTKAHALAIQRGALSETNQELAAQWHPTKNGELTPDMVTRSSNKKVWWKCEKGHEWEAIIANRTRGSGCPYCAGRYVIKGENDLASCNPALAAQWHPTKNGMLTPDQVTKSSEKIVWWQCENGHEWRTRIVSRNGGGGCPCCSGHQIMRGFNDLSTTDPYVAAQWHPTKNGKLTPDMVTRNSGKKVWWLCPDCGHEWKTAVQNKTSQPFCSYCNHKRLRNGGHTFSEMRPDLVKYWHPAKNGKLTPDMVTFRSHKNVWWQCPDCGHEWQRSVDWFQGIKKCPHCSGLDIRVRGIPLITTNPEIAAQWHPTKNGNLTPDQVTFGSEKKVWWLCPDCGHEWEARVTNRTRGSRCPNCRKIQTIARRKEAQQSKKRAKQSKVKKNPLARTHPELAAQWHPTKNGELTPDMVAHSASKRVWWQCPDCGHEWRMGVAYRIKAAAECPFCTKRRVTILDNNPELAAQWHPTKNESLTPAQTTCIPRKMCDKICD